jgi:hypothetical protein
MNNKFWKSLKRNLSILTALIGVTIPIFCFYLLPNINILFDPLSRFGIEPQTKFIWLCFMQIIAILLYFINKINIIKISENISPIQNLILNSLNIISSLSLSLTGLITMEIRLFHLGLATIFFLSYTGFIFWWGYLNIKYNLKIAIFSIISSIFIMSSSFITAFGYGYGMFEIIFITSIILWNIFIRDKI